jgi:hypothetical protein
MSGAAQAQHSPGGVMSHVHRRQASRSILDADSSNAIRIKHPLLGMLYSSQTVSDI